MTFDFLIPKKIDRFSATAQICIVLLLYICTVAIGYAEFRAKGTLWGYPLSISILFVPIYEEIIFRGVLLEQFSKHFSNSKSSILVSALFAAWHLKNIFWLSPFQLIYQIVFASVILSPIFCWITLKTKSIWPAIILHYINNILASGSFLWVIL